MREASALELRSRTVLGTVVRAVVARSVSSTEVAVVRTLVLVRAQVAQVAVGPNAVADPGAMFQTSEFPKLTVQVQVAPVQEVQVPAVEVLVVEALVVPVVTIRSLKAQVQPLAVPVPVVAQVLVAQAPELPKLGLDFAVQARAAGCQVVAAQELAAARRLVAPRFGCFPVAAAVAAERYFAAAGS